MKRHLLSLILFLFVAGITWAQPTLIPGSTTVYWEIKNDTALHITGTRAMPNFANATSQTWAASRDAITQLSIAEGITSIGSYAFDYCSKLTQIISKAIVPPTMTTSVFGLHLSISPSMCLANPRTVTVKHAEGEALAVFDMLGRTILQTTATEESTFNLPTAGGLCGENWEGRCEESGSSIVES